MKKRSAYMCRLDICISKSPNTKPDETMPKEKELG